MALTDPVQIIRALLADIGIHSSGLPSVRNAYDYLERIEVGPSIADKIELFNATHKL